MHLQTKLHTVFLLVGPSKSGKTTFSKVLVHELKRAGLMYGTEYRVAHLSSDAIRERLLDSPNRDTHAPDMLEVSEQAFDLLYAELKAVTSYPVNNEFVVVDTTGLNEKFRNDVREIATSRGYRVELVVFDYSRNEVYRDVDEKYHYVIRRQLAKLKKEVLPNLKAKIYDNCTRITSRSVARWQDLKVEVGNGALYSRCTYHLKPGQSVAIIGDTHEHVEALDELLLKLDRPTQVVHIGDYLDKGGNTEAMLKKMQDRVSRFGDILVHGNHEAYVVRRLRGEIDPNPEIEEKYITSLKVLFDRPDLQEILFDLWDNHSVPFLKIIGDHCRTMFVTHAPCDEVNLGKLFPAALKAQRNLRSKNRDSDYRNDFDFVFKQAGYGKPLHVFGHVSHKGTLVFKNKVFLDTGAVYGHKLTALVYLDDNYDLVQVDAKPLVTDTELSDQLTRPPRVEKPFDIRDYDLDESDLRFVEGFVKKGAKFISGTMAPAPSTDTELESLDAGLEYFRKHGVKEVVVQPKYMGSRCQLYLFNNPEEQSFAVSRRGYKISPDRVPGLGDLIADWRSRVDDWYEGEWDEIILDGELMPWSALGKPLIERQFWAYVDLIDWELDQLDDPDFAALDFPDKPDVKSRYQDLLKFTKTLELYDKDVGDGEGQVPLHFKAFSVLAVDGCDLTDDDQREIFGLLNDDVCISVDPSREEQVQSAHEFFKQLTVDQGMEGVVLKPRFQVEGVVPYMKVRNEEYLRLVYGYDYPRRYEALCRQKNVSGKLGLSLKEWELGRQMLVAKSDDQMKELVIKMIGHLKAEQSLDPRL